MTDPLNQLVRSSAWNGLPELVRELGGDPVAVLAEAGLTLEDLNSSDDPLPFESFIRSLNAGAKATGRADFGMLSATRAGLNVLGVLGIAIRNARTLSEALDICVRFIRINTSSTTISRVPIPGAKTVFIGMESRFPIAAETVQLYERMLATLHMILELIGREHHDPLEFRFMHSRLSPIAAYKTTFGKTPKFDQPSMGMVLNAESLDAEIAGRSAELGDMAMSVMRNMSSNTSESFADTSRTIAKVLIELGACTPADLANALSVHERTLQRRLKDEGLSFEVVRDKARSEIAEVLLRQDAHSLTEIAHILGYADSSTFSRSCQRWFGDTPTGVRAQTRTD